MKIAYFVDHFPVLSETFIINQIKGVMTCGEEVAIFANRPALNSTALIPKDLSLSGLLERTHYESEAYQRMPRNKMARMGHALFLAWAKAPKHLPVILKSVDVFRHGTKAASLALFYAILPYLDYDAFDIVHCQFGTLAPKALMLKKMGVIKGKLVVSFRGFDITQFIKDKPGYYNEVFREGTLFLPVSEAIKKRLIEEGCPQEKIVVHHSGILMDQFGFRRRTMGKGEAIKVVSVGRLVAKKGIAYGIKAVAKLVEKGIPISYTVLGGGQLKNELCELIHGLGMEKYITMTGELGHDEVIKRMDNAHVLMAPSITADDGDQEGIPNVIKEAMSLGLPVISTFHGGIPELVENGVSGLLVAERNADALADALIFLYEHPDTWPEMGEAGRKKIEMAFDSKRQNSDLIHLYKGLL